MVIVKTSDGTIWEQSNTIINIINEILTTGQAIVDSNFDGPCAEHAGIYNMFDSICSTLDIPKSKITFITTNQLEQHNDYNIVIRSPWTYIKPALDVSFHNTTKQFSSDFKRFGCFIGHGNSERTWLMSQMYKNHKDSSLLTYHYTHNHGYFNYFIGLDQYYHEKSSEFSDVVNLLDNSPITLDEINELPIVLPTTYNISKIYHKFFVEIVCLTYFSGNTFYVDEKIWRPIINKTPFIVQGPKNFIENFKLLGFKTFDRWWSEGHNQDIAHSQKYSIIDIVKYLETLSDNQIINMYNEMQEVLDYNYNHLMNISDGDFKRVQNGKK